MKQMRYFVRLKLTVGRLKCAGAYIQPYN